MNEPSGETHKLTSLADLLILTPEQMKRLVPDLLKWHVTHSLLCALLECTPDDLGASMEWTDDGENRLTHINVDLGEHGVVDLLKPATWPDGPAQKGTP